MSIVDTVMVGRLSPEAIGAVSVGSSLFLAVAIFGIGLLLGLDPLVSQAFGAGDYHQCWSWLKQGVTLSLFVSLPLTLLMLLPIQLLRVWGTEPRVLDLTIPYLETLSWSILPLLLYATFRRFLQALSSVKSVMFALASANVVNALTNYGLIFGNWGLPELGVEGAGWATFISRVYMAAFLLLFVLRAKRRLSMVDSGSWVNPLQIRRLIGLGLPAALQLVLEVGVFALATALASRLDTYSLAAHQVVLATASFTFMVPLGISAAGAVRVGQCMGAQEMRMAASAGWMALSLGTGFMSLATLAFLVFPRTILGVYTTDTLVLAIGIPLLAVAAVFQVFDGLQVIATGVLRGVGDTKTPMYACLLGHWCLALPAGYVLCFVLDWGIFGLWIGLCIGLISVAIWLTFIWQRRIRVLVEAPQ
jgi:MATE family multidrug resistance protein